VYKNGLEAREVTHIYTIAFVIFLYALANLNEELVSRANQAWDYVAKLRAHQISAWKLKHLEIYPRILFHGNNRLDEMICITNFLLAYTDSRKCK
jgi:hypothetical protein